MFRVRVRGSCSGFQVPGSRFFVRAGGRCPERRTRNLEPWNPNPNTNLDPGTWNSEPVLHQAVLGDE